MDSGLRRNDKPGFVVRVVTVVFKAKPHEA